MAKAARAQKAPKQKAGNFLLMAIQKNTANVLHINCESLEDAIEKAKEKTVDWNYPIYCKLPTNEMHIINQPNK